MRLALALILAASPAWAQRSHEAYYHAFDAAIRRNHLVDRPQCVAYEDFEDMADHFDVDVLEKHGPGCPGDRGTEPRLFTLRFVKASGTVLQSDDVAGPDAFKTLR